MSDLKQLYDDQLDSRIRSAAARYRALADKLDRLADRVPDIGTSGTVTASHLAHDAVHEVAWGSANANLAAIVTAAAEHDRVIGADR